MCALVVAIPTLVVTTTREAWGATPSPLLTRPRFGEFQPVRGENFIAWQQNTRKNPDQYDVFARALDGSGTFRVNPTRVNGANGDIDGDVLVYQQFRRNKSNLRFFDLVGRTHSNPPAGVNTPQWEYWPSMSGDLLLFARLFDNGVRRIILFDLSAGTARRLDKTRGAGAFLAPGQVNGDYAVWHKCRSNTDCDVIRFHIPDGQRTTLPNPGRNQHAASVTADGTVFFARSRGGCGTGTRLMRLPLGGDAVILSRLPTGDDISATDAFTDAEGMTMVLFDQFDCARAAVSDAWEIGEDLTPVLTVKVEGDASGTVTSSPAGINCGSDCTESYEVGTGVTLTATPAAGATFAGWGGACTGTNTTCTLAMNGPRSVTATFTDKPVLTVVTSGNGEGTVTSSPSGISCPTDCNEPYTEGTSVVLTAAPNSASSTFGGWTGACSGMSLTCTVTMDGDRSATAMFTLEKRTLSFSKAGDGQGTVTSSPAGISCDPTCTSGSADYDHDTDVTLTAVPDPDTTLVSWTDCDSVSGVLNETCTVDMTDDKTVIATFDAIP